MWNCENTGVSIFAVPRIVFYVAHRHQYPQNFRDLKFLKCTIFIKVSKRVLISFHLHLYVCAAFFWGGSGDIASQWCRDKSRRDGEPYGSVGSIDTITQSETNYRTLNDLWLVCCSLHFLCYTINCVKMREMIVRVRYPDFHLLPKNYREFPNWLMNLEIWMRGYCIKWIFSVEMDRVEYFKGWPHLTYSDSNRGIYRWQGGVVAKWIRYN